MGVRVARDLPSHSPRSSAMTLCPVALAVGCRKCPVFAVCPVKGVIGDQAPKSDAKSEGGRAQHSGTRSKRK